MNPKIKDWVGIAAILALVIGAYSAVVYSKSMRPGEYREFAVTGEGKVTAVPDVAQFTFSVITEGGTDLASLQKQNVDKTNKAIDFVKSKGVEAKDIKTLDFNVNPKYTYPTCAPYQPCSSNGTITGYTIIQTVSVKVRDFSKTGELLSGAVSNGANSVSSLSFTVDDRTKLENDAREQAIQQARTKAEATAKASDFKLGKLVAIEDSASTPYYYDAYGRGGDAANYAVKSESAAIAPAPAVEAGSQEITVNVVLRYQIR